MDQGQTSLMNLMKNRIPLPIQVTTHITSKFVDFVFEGMSKSGRTEIWFVFSKDSDLLLGEVKWFGKWRRYCFYTIDSTIFDWSCLRDIADLCEARMKVRNNRER
jgi:hypothetical protein